MRAKIDKPFVSRLKVVGNSFEVSDTELPAGTRWGHEVSDTELPGFILRVRESGAMFYAVRYRVNGGPSQRLTIGSAAVISAQDARNKAKKHLADATRGTDPGAAKREAKAVRLTLERFLEDELYPNHLKKLRHGEAARKRFKHAFKDFLDLPLDKIDEKRIARWKAAATCKSSTINRYLSDLRAALRLAVEWGDLSAAPRFKLERVDRSGTVRYLTADEETRLLAALDTRDEKIRAGRDSFNEWARERDYPERTSLRAQTFTDHLKPLVLVSLHTGARRGELFNLRWNDVDLAEKRITILGAGAKSGQTRHIPLNSTALEIIEKWHAQRPSNDYVFPSANGTRLDNVKTSWEGLLKEAKIERFRWHDMRHHFASKLVMAGVDLNTVRELLGHADLAMTLRYAHLAPEIKAEAVQRLCVPEGKVIAFTGKRKGNA